MLYQIIGVMSDTSILTALSMQYCFTIYSYFHYEKIKRPESAPVVSPVTIIPEMRTPRKINKSDFFAGIPNRSAASDPVQAPVIGRGIATNNISANSPYTSYFF